MDVFEALYTTRAMRRLDVQPIPDDQIAQIIDAGVRAPSPGAADSQSWRFVAVTDRTLMRELAELWRQTRDALLLRMPGLYPNERQAASSQYLHDHFAELPLLILGYGPPGIGTNTVVPACWSMCLAARALGMGSTFTTLLSQATSEVNRIIGAPADMDLVLYAALPIGFPLGRWGVAPRQAAHLVTYADRWGNPPSWTAQPTNF